MEDSIIHFSESIFSKLCYELIESSIDTQNVLVAQVTRLMVKYGILQSLDYRITIIIRLHDYYNPIQSIAQNNL